MRYILLSGMFCLLSAALPVFATVSNSIEQSSTTVSVSDQNTAIGTASDWGLTTEEWQRYQQWMQGADGLWHTQLSPPEVLGLHADTPEEQQHFAQLVAKQEHDRVAREFAFNQAVFLAMRQLYADEPMIKDFDKTPFNPNKNQPQNKTVLQAGDHLALFEKTQALDVAILPKLLAILQANPKIGLDIYCVGNWEDNAIQQWAALNRIPASWVQSGRITLNHSNKPVSTPYLVLMRDGKSTPISVWDL